MKHNSYDVVVIGAGHAGTEAAHAAWRMGVRVALVTFRRSDIGVMSCNPAIGGLGKGHLVREIDALDGVMGRVADRAAIQFRLLNRRKGPAVRGPRVQADRALYQAAMTTEIERAVGLEVIEGEAVDILISDNGKVTGVDLADGSRLDTTTIVLTSGTFLKGLMHVGGEQTVGGRVGAQSSARLADRVRDLGLRTGRLKTGTPPRLIGGSIDYADLEVQEGDEHPVLFSFLHRKPFAAQISCAITHTNEQTHEIIRKNLGRSAMYGGMIEGTGPRYCPSIEDKVVRFSEKTSHQIFLEPESLTSDLIYPNGISTSLPADVQLDYVRSIKGLGRAKIAQLGYAIEYDYVDPVQLTSSLSLGSVPGLFLAGQINGTTGYEEAAAQGLVAGLNAANAVLDRESVRFSRSESYIGVMIDDLTTRGVTEPYRMFTSRAEYRLLLRADNADSRLTGRGLNIGCVGENRRAIFEDKQSRLEAAAGLLRNTVASNADLQALNIEVRANAPSRSCYDVLGLKGCLAFDLKNQFGALASLSVEDLEQVQCDAIYASYVDRQHRDVERVRANELLSIPDDFDYDQIDGISLEVRERLARVRPENLAQASGIEGVTSAAIVTLLAAMQRNMRRSAG